MIRSVTLADILDGHVVLDIDCVDRIYLNGYVPSLQTSGQVVGFLHSRGFPIPSPAALGRNGNAFRTAVRAFADAGAIPWVVFGKDDRKIEVMRPYLEAAERAGVSAVVAIGVAQEYQWVWDATTKPAVNGIPWFDYHRTERRTTCYYFYIWDERMGGGFIKVSAYAPYPIKVWLNGHEIVKRMAVTAGLQVTALANGFAATTNRGLLQDLADQVQAGTLRVFFERWMSRLPLPLNDADRDRGYWWQLSMRQIEISRTLVIDDPRRVRTLFEQLLRDNLDLGRPEHLEVIFARRITRRTPGHVRHPAAVAFRSGHPQPVLPALPHQDLPQTGPGAAHRDRRQQLRRPGVSSRPGPFRRTRRQGACGQRPPDGCCTCRSGRWRPCESSH
jgi:hypothetical protein